MKPNEFNLSVLENVTQLGSPFKNGSNYEEILGLIQEEFEMQKETETDSQNVVNPHNLDSELEKHCDFHKTENSFTSPDRKLSSRPKSRTSLLRNCHSHEKDKHKSSDKLNLRKGRSLGAAKPRRSFNMGPKNKHLPTARSFNILPYTKNTSLPESRNMTPKSKDFGEDPTDNEFSDILKVAQAPSVDKNSVDIETHPKFTPEEIPNNRDASEMPRNPEFRQFSQVEPVAFEAKNSCSPKKSQDSDFVASSQSTTNSSLRQKLYNLRRSSANQPERIERKGDEKKQNRSVASEDGDQNLTLQLSPRYHCESSAGTRSATTSITRKRKVSPLEWYEIVSTKHQKIYTSDEEGSDCAAEPEKNHSEGTEMNSSKKTMLGSSRKGQNEISTPSPLKGLSQELNHCITERYYEQMSEDLKTEMLNVTDFSFETIELLNDYEACNEKANNQILSRVFWHSPLEIKEEPLDPSASHEQPPKDPLHLEAKPASSPTKIDRRTLVANKRSVRNTRRVSNKFLMKQIEGIENVAPSTSKTRKSAGERVKLRNAQSNGIAKYFIRPRRSPRKSLSENIRENELVVTAKRKLDRNPMKRRSQTTKSISDAEDEINGNEQRGSTSGLKIETESPSHSSDSEDDDLSVKAFDISREIEEVEKKSRLSDETVEMLESLVIELRHEVLPQHKIERKATSKHLTFEERKKFTKFAPLERNTYSAAEDERIKANWEAFCEDHNWEPTNYEPFLDFKQGDELIVSLNERRKFAQFLADGLPNRSLYSVYGRFKRLFQKSRSTGSRYTEEEDRKILAYMLQESAESQENRCYELSKVLGRKRDSIWARFKKLKEKNVPNKKKDVLSRVDWTLSLVEKYVTGLLDVTLSEDLMELKDAFLPKVVWLAMETQMKIKWQILSRFWEQQLHLQLFATRPIHLNQIKIELIEHIHSSKIAHPMDIKWNRVLAHFDGLTTYFLRKTFSHLTVQTSKTLQTRDFKRIIDWLRTVKTCQLIDTTKDKCLPRILYSNKKAEFLLEDIEEIRSPSGSLETAQRVNNEII